MPDAAPDADDSPCPDWFRAWAFDYGNALGVREELAGVMVRRWWPAFAAARYTQADLEAALPKILMSDRPPRWPNEHVPAVRAAVAAVRADRRPGRAAGIADSPSRCHWCQWLGVVIVPHPGDVREGSWAEPHRTGGVFCTRCEPGKRAFDAACNHAHEGRIRHPPMSLDQYEQRVTADWATMLVERDEAERLMVRALDATEATGPSASAFTDVIRRRVGRAS